MRDYFRLLYGHPVSVPFFLSLSIFFFTLPHLIFFWGGAEEDFFVGDINLKESIHFVILFKEKYKILSSPGMVERYTSFVQ